MSTPATPAILRELAAALAEPDTARRDLARAEERARVLDAQCSALRDERDHATTQHRAIVGRCVKHPDALWLLDVSGTWATDESAEGER